VVSFRPRPLYSSQGALATHRGDPLAYETMSFHYFLSFHRPKPTVGCSANGRRTRRRRRRRRRRRGRRRRRRSRRRRRRRRRRAQ